MTLSQAVILHALSTDGPMSAYAMSKSLDGNGLMSAKSADRLLGMLAKNGFVDVTQERRGLQLKSRHYHINVEGRQELRAFLSDLDTMFYVCRSCKQRRGLIDGCLCKRLGAILSLRENKS